MIGLPQVALQEDEGTEGLVRWRARGVPRARARPLRFVDVAGTDPSTSAVPACVAPVVGDDQVGDNHR